MGDRAFGIALLLFALPSLLPLSAIPGVSVIFSIPILLIAIQMIFSMKTIWLPRLVAEKKVSHQHLSKIIHASLPFLKKVEKLLKPRLCFMTSRVMEILNGLVIVFLSILLMTPIPLSNFIFSGLIIIFSFGLIEDDGLFILAGYLGTILYVYMMYGIVLGAIKIIF